MLRATVAGFETRLQISGDIWLPQSVIFQIGRKEIKFILKNSRGNRWA